MEPWSIVVTGSKSELLAMKLPGCVAKAVAALMEPMAEVPGWTDDEPRAIWEAHCKAHPDMHNIGEKPPALRSELWDCKWKVETSGHPDAHGGAVIKIEAVRQRP